MNTKWNEWTKIADDETLWKDDEERGLLKAEYQGEYVLRLWFEEELDVSIYDLDFYPLLVEENPGHVMLPLENLERFRYVEGDYALVWLNPETGIYDENVIDLAPECVRFFCDKYGKKVKEPQSMAI